MAVAKKMLTLNIIKNMVDYNFNIATINLFFFFLGSPRVSGPWAVACFLPVNLIVWYIFIFYFLPAISQSEVLFNSL